MRRWQRWVLVAGALAGLVVAGRITAPPAAAPPAAAPGPVDTAPSCDRYGITRRSAGPSDGPQAHPPIAGLRLDPASPRPGDLGSRRARALARRLVDHHVDTITTRARLFRVTRPPRLRRARAWVVAVSGVPAGLGFCGPVGSREVVVVLDAVTGRQLLSYSYR
jgi:hypothetical protein